MVVPFSILAQVDIRATLSQTILNIDYGKSMDKYHFLYGGAGLGTPALGVEVEMPLRKRRPVTIDSLTQLPKGVLFGSVAMCLYYSNHTHSVQGRSEFYDPLHSRFDVRLIQIPLIYKGNFRLSILEEDVRFSFGIGIVNSYILKSSLQEVARAFTRDQNGNAIVDANGNNTWIDYADSKVTTDYGRRFYNSFCFEVSIGFKRLFISERAWFSPTDMYMSSLSDNWNVPRSHSVYFNAYDTWNKISYGGGQFTIGWKFN